MSSEPIPLERIYNLGRLGSAGDEVVVSANTAELVQLAHWGSVRSVESFSAKIDLRRLSSSRFSYDAVLQTEIVQDCVVTLEPVRSVLKRRTRRELHLAETSRFPADGDVVVDPVSDDDDVREEIASLHYDLAAPLLEELVLAIDPYPRAPGVAFAAPPDPATKPESPFAVLKNLKK